MTSAPTIASQIPSKPQSSGNVSTAATSNTSVRSTEITAEISPLLSAVKNDEANIAKPEKTRTRRF